MTLFTFKKLIILLQLCVTKFVKEKKDVFQQYYETTLFSDNYLKYIIINKHIHKREIYIFVCIFHLLRM